MKRLRRRSRDGDGVRSWDYIWELQERNCDIICPVERCFPHLEKLHLKKVVELNKNG
jgi:hypothetical protein